MSRRSEALAAFLKREPLPCIIAAAVEHDAPVLCVGGAVRDMLLSRPAADIDIAVAGDLDAFVQRFARHCGRVPVAIGDPWRDTRRTKLGETQVDLGAMLGDEAQDLAARDFTINAMAVRLDGSAPDAARLLDQHRGEEDLEGGHIRMLSAAALRHDPLRMLRALRYFAVLDGFTIEASTRAAMEAGAAAIGAVAAERVQAEWAELLGGGRWLEASRLACEMGLGGPLPGCEASFVRASMWADFEATNAAQLADEDRALLRLSALLADAATFSEDETQRQLVERRWPQRRARQAARIAAWAKRVHDEEDLVAWVMADRTCAARAALLARALAPPADAKRAARIDQLETYARRAAEEAWVSGVDLRSWGLSEGPGLGALLGESTRGQIERRWDNAQSGRAWARDRAAAVVRGG